MFLKLIRCRVLTDYDRAFSHAQEGWTDTRHSPGFIMQWGGWEMGQPRNAWILSFWEKEDDLLRFMDLDHDRIDHENGQANTYSAITVQHARLVETQASSLDQTRQKLFGSTSSCNLHFSSLPLVDLPDDIFHFNIPESQQSNVYIQLTNNHVKEPPWPSPGITIKWVDTWHIPSLPTSKSLH